MKRSPPDSITQKVRRIFGRGMLEGVRVADYPATTPQAAQVQQEADRG